MAGNRKNRQPSNVGSSESSKPHPAPTSNATSSKELLEAVEEVDGFIFRLSFAEVTVLLVMLVSLVFSTFLVAMAAEMSISVHYFDKPSPPVFSELDKREQELSNHRFRVTIPEQDMAAVHTAHHDANKYRLQRVIQVEPSGHPKTMLVVEQSSTERERSSHSATHGADAPFGDSGAKVRPPVMESTTLTIQPKLCADGSTIGFDTWDSLKTAVLEANKLSVDQFVRWSRFFADNDISGTFNEAELYYEQEMVFKICPGTKLRAKKGPIFINAPNVILECEGCTVSVGASHFSFGPNAKNVVIRGITFTKASTSSLLFFHNGAEVAFEDCFWHGNTAINSRFGAVADINSTSNVNFYRCNIGRGRRGENDLASSLSIRT